MRRATTRDGRVGSREQQPLGALREYATDAVALAFASREGERAFSARCDALWCKPAWRDALGPLLALFDLGYVLEGLDDYGVTLGAATL